VNDFIERIYRETKQTKPMSNSASAPLASGGRVTRRASGDSINMRRCMPMRNSG
jgi:hypothetical protein